MVYSQSGANVRSDPREDDGGSVVDKKECIVIGIRKNILVAKIDHISHSELVSESSVFCSIIR